MEDSRPIDLDPATRLELRTHVNNQIDIDTSKPMTDLTHCIVQRQLGRAIIDRRTQLNLSQRQLAALSNVHRTYLCEIEHGTRNVTIETLNKIAESLGLSLFALVRTAENYEH